MIYFKYDADIEDIHPNVANQKFGFIVRCKDDKKEYFVKPSWRDHFHNENEYIAHHIASLIGAPVPDGRFLKISPQNFELWSRYVDDRQHSYREIFKPPYGDAIFFGVEILRAKHVSSIQEINTELQDTSNKTAFFSQYPLDQHLKNPDRHIGNYFFFLKEMKKHFCLIDFDRIFYGATDWSMLDDIDDFECFAKAGYNADLYHIVDNDSLRHLRKYAAEIERIRDEDIVEIIQTLGDVFPRTKPYLVKIENWIKKRRDIIYEKCMQNDFCYTSVTKKGVFSVSR